MHAGGPRLHARRFFERLQKVVVRHEVIGRRTVKHNDLDLRIGFGLVHDLDKISDLRGADDIGGRDVEGDYPVRSTLARQADLRGLRAGLRAHPGHHLPRCAPPSTCSTSPVMRGASVRKRTASTISLTLETPLIGESVFRNSFGLSLCSGVSTTPGATVL